MKIFQCDRCGKTYSKTADRESLKFRVTWNYEYIDLCDDCFEKLQEWMDDMRKEG